MPVLILVFRLASTLVGPTYRSRSSASGEEAGDGETGEGGSLVIAAYVGNPLLECVRGGGVCMAVL